jgi:phosphate transport system protein
MGTHFEESLQRDIDRICSRVKVMAGFGERALWDSLRALQQGSRQLAYTVVLRDQRIDELEQELDRLCLEFLVRQQPVGRTLRFVYATIRINLELERVGDYAESVARQVIKLIGMNAAAPTQRFEELANLAVPMLANAVNAFVKQDAGLAQTTMEVESTVDTLRSEIDAELFHLRQDGKIPLEALTPLMTISRRFERVSDQAKNICQEVVYMCTGEDHRHKGQEVYRLLFVDENNGCRSVMAEAIGHGLGQPRFLFSSAGLEPKPIDARTLEFLVSKGLETARLSPKRLDQVPNLDHYQVVVGLAKGLQKVLPTPPRKTVYLDWNMADPSEVRGTETEVREAYEAAYREIEAHTRDLVDAVVGDAAGETKPARHNL